MTAKWQYDELTRVGVDFHDADEVAEYERKQGVDPAREATLIERLGVSPAHTVVDLGCGTGSFARAVADHGATVIAIDPSEPMLAYCEAHNRAGSKLRCQRAGFLTFDLPSDSVDFVVSRFALHHLPDFWKQVAVGRIADVLRPGGVFYLVDVAFSFDPANYADRARTWIEETAANSGWSQDDLAAHIREEFSTYSWILQGILEHAGFEVSAENPTTEYAEFTCWKPAQG